MLTKICGPSRQEVKGDCVVEEGMWQAQERIAYGILFLRHEKRTHVVPIRRSYGVKIYLTIRWEGVDWIRLAQDRDRFQALVTEVMNLLVP